MSVTDGTWGTGDWGTGGWGGPAPAIELVGAEALRENVIRLEFSAPVYFSQVLDAPDASIVAKYVVTAVDGTFDRMGVAARAVRVVEVDLALADGDPPVAPEDQGRFLDLLLDRTMSSFPAWYQVDVQGVWTQELTDVVAPASAQVPAVFQIAQEATQEASRGADIANPMTGSGARAAGVLAGVEAALGTFVVQAGDYALDQGDVSLAKRVLRRAMATPGAFHHLGFNYGGGARDAVKRNATGRRVGQLTTGLEQQMLRDPDIAKCSVTITPHPAKPGLFRLNIVVMPKGGKPFRVAVPLAAT